jgi:hypothetical protein
MFFYLLSHEIYASRQSVTAIKLRPANVRLGEITTPCFYLSVVIMNVPTQLCIPDMPQNTFPKFSLCLIKHQAMKTYSRGQWEYASLVLDRGVVCFTPRPLYPPVPTG